MKRCQAALAVVMVVLMALTTAGYAEARGGVGGRAGGFHGGGGGSFHRGGAGGFHGGGGGSFHGGQGGFHGRPGFHGHPGFHHGFHGRGFVGVAPFFWWGPGYAYDPYPVPSGYWYYCPSAQAYYPYVQTCPEPWVPVPAS